MGGTSNLPDDFEVLKIVFEQRGRFLSHKLQIEDLKLEHSKLKRMQYALARCKALARYRDDGRVEIDNNTAERACFDFILLPRSWNSTLGRSQ